MILSAMYTVDLSGNTRCSPQVRCYAKHGLRSGALLLSWALA